MNMMLQPCLFVGGIIEQSTLSATLSHENSYAGSAPTEDTICQGSHLFLYGVRFGKIGWDDEFELLDPDRIETQRRFYGCHFFRGEAVAQKVFFLDEFNIHVFQKVQDGQHVMVALKFHDVVGDCFAFLLKVLIGFLVLIIPLKKSSIGLTKKPLEFSSVGQAMDLNETKSLSEIAFFPKPAFEKGFFYPKYLNKLVDELGFHEKLIDTGKAPVKSFFQLGGAFRQFVHIVNLLFDKPPLMKVILNNLFLDLLGQCRNNIILHVFLISP